MKTYIVNAGTSNKMNLVAVLAANKTEAFLKVKQAKGSAQKSSVKLSACDIAYVSCETI